MAPYKKQKNEKFKNTTLYFPYLFQQQISYHL